MAAPMAGPYFTGETLKQKRKMVYKTLQFNEISKIHYQQFFNEYLVPNKPCLFDQTLTEKWRSRREWVQIDGAPNLEFLRRNFGSATVPVANCKKEEYSSHPKQDFTLGEYLNYWESYRKQNYPSDLPCLYLKDWHFTKAFPDYEAYETPIYFQSDWLNEFWDTRAMDDYRFVYMGPKGTWTPFHSDVYRSFSWSANICGKKKWIFYPPGQEEYLKDRFGNLVYDVRSPELHDRQKYPHFDKVKDQKLEVIQGQGQVMFVPSGWHHQVLNMEDTISINHNWLNGCNIDICWSHLQDSLESVKREINDLKDMEGWNEQCQVILNASAGINYETFIQMLKVIIINRLHVLDTRKASGIGENTNGGPTHLRVINGHHDYVKTDVDKLESSELHKPSLKGGFDGAVTECTYQGQINDKVTELASEKWFNDRNSSCDKCCDKSVTNATSSLSEERLFITGNCSKLSTTDGPEGYNCKVESCKSTASRGEHPVNKDSFMNTNQELPAELEHTDYNYNDNFSEMSTTVECTSQGQINDMVTELASEKWFNDRNSSCDKCCDKPVTNGTSSLSEERLFITGNCSKSSTTDGPEGYNCKVESCKSTASRGEHPVTKDSFMNTNQELPAELEHTDYNYNDNFSEMSTTVSGKYSVSDVDHMTEEDVGKHKESVDDDQLEHYTENVNIVKHYVLYDLYRIKETLVDIMDDKDYRELSFEKENTAEFLYEQIEAKLNG